LITQNQPSLTTKPTFFYSHIIIYQTYFAVFASMGAALAPWALTIWIFLNLRALTATGEALHHIQLLCTHYGWNAN